MCLTIIYAINKLIQLNKRYAYSFLGIYAGAHVYSNKDGNHAFYPGWYNRSPSTFEGYDNVGEGGGLPVDHNIVHVTVWSKNGSSVVSRA